MTKLLPFFILFMSTGIFSTISAAVPATASSLMQVDSLVPLRDSTQVVQEDPAEKPSKVAQISTLIALSAAMSFLVIGFQVRLAFAAIFVLASAVAFVSGLIALGLSKPKTKQRRRALFAILLAPVLLGVAALIALSIGFA
ncbi:MAG: hypothetical protein JNM22_15320 [Saprospiraceae bacterium]|nr:hypothetical protein [Saprospiraceae bacterium]